MVRVVQLDYVIQAADDIMRINYHLSKVSCRICLLFAFILYTQSHRVVQEIYNNKVNEGK